MQNNEQTAGRESGSASATWLDGDEILEALKECEYALKMAIEKDKIGWLQQVAHQTACDALNKHLAAKKAKPSNEKAQ
jgi:hypothetical protein